MITKVSSHSVVVLLLALANGGCHQATMDTAVERDGSWHTAPSMLHARAAHAVVSTGDAIYAIGGTGAGGQPVLEVERFDGRAWRDIGTLPGNGLNAPVAAFAGKRIFVIGGFNTTTNIPNEHVLVLDIESNRWSEVAPLPNPRGGHGVAVLRDRIHVLGGGNSRSTLADHSMYDPATNRWSELAPLPRSEGSPAVVAFNGRIWSIGGRTGPGDFGFVDIYDPRADRWTAGPAFEPRGTAGAVVYCGAIHVVGGESQARSTSLAEHLRLAPGDSTWSSLPPLPTARNFARAVLFRDEIWVVGGSPAPGRSHASEGSAIVERYHAACRTR